MTYSPYYLYRVVEIGVLMGEETQQETFLGEDPNEAHEAMCEARDNVAQGWCERAEIWCNGELQEEISRV